MGASILNIETYTVIYLITNFFNIAIIHKFMHIFFDYRRSHWCLCIGSYLLHFIITSMLYLFFDIPLLTLCANYCIMLLIALNYEARIQKQLLSAVYVLIFMAIPELIVVGVTGYFNFSVFTEGNYSNSLGAITVRLITYMEALLFSNFKAVKNNQHINKTVWTASVLFPISTLVLEIMFFESGHVTQFTLTLSVALIFLLTILVFYLYDSLALSYIKIAETAVLEKEKELYYNQCHIMQNSTKDLQAFRHDLNNQFAVISELLDAEKYDSVKTHVQGLLKKTGDKMIYSTTGHTPIDSIINYKLQNAVNNHIKVQTEVVVPMDLEIDISDIITIIGNLLDNSLYALKQLPEHKRTLTLKIMYSRERLFIQVSNPYLTKVQYENGEIITAKDDKQNHGFGLKNIEKAVEKYNGFMEINHENMTFTVDILLYLSFKN